MMEIQLTLQEEEIMRICWIKTGKTHVGNSFFLGIFTSWIYLGLYNSLLQLPPEFRIHENVSFRYMEWNWDNMLCMILYMYREDTLHICTYLSWCIIRMSLPICLRQVYYIIHIHFHNKVKPNYVCKMHSVLVILIFLLSFTFIWSDVFINHNFRASTVGFPGLPQTVAHSWNQNSFESVTCGADWNAFTATNMSR